MKAIYKIIILGAMLFSLIAVYVAVVNRYNCCENCKNQTFNKCDTVKTSAAYNYKIKELNRIHNAPLRTPCPDDVFLVTTLSDTTL